MSYFNALIYIINKLLQKNSMRYIFLLPGSEKKSLVCLICSSFWFSMAQSYVAKILHDSI